MSETINGSLSVSNDVIADIAGYAAMTCYGVVGMAEQLQGAESVRLLAGQRLRKGVLGLRRRERPYGRSSRRARERRQHEVRLPQSFELRCLHPAGDRPDRSRQP